MKMQEKYDISEKGISSNYIHMGGQYNQILLINFDEYFSYLEMYANLKDNKSEKKKNQGEFNKYFIIIPYMEFYFRFRL